MVQRRGLGQTLNETGVDRDTFEVYINERFRENYDVNYGDIVGSVFNQHLQRQRSTGKLGASMSVLNTYHASST